MAPRPAAPLTPQRSAESAPTPSTNASGLSLRGAQGGSGTGSGAARCRQRAPRARLAEFDELVSPAYGLAELSRIFETDLRRADLNKPLPEIPGEAEIQGDKSRSTLVLKLARTDNLSVRQLVTKLGGGRGHLTLAGAPEQIVEVIEEWFSGGAADGFNVMRLVLPGDFERFADHVLPLLRQRGLCRNDYDGMTLREHYGLDRPASRLAAGTAAPHRPA